MYILYPLNLAQQNNLAIKLRLNNMLKSSTAITTKVIQDSALTVFAIIYW